MPPLKRAGGLTPLKGAGGLTPYTAPLDARTAAHLLRRTCFGAAPDRVTAWVGRSAEEAVDALVDAALALPLPEAPPWAETPPPSRDADPAAFEQYLEDNALWLMEARSAWVEALYAGGLREKMTLFWHNHFVTATETYGLAPFAHRYLSTLRTHALGNFKDFVYNIGLDPAMLIYLNGNTNTAGAPNENYARELLELFTMGEFDRFGQANYTQEDIQQIARALTGWVVDYHTLQVHFILFLFDGGEKTIMGRTGYFTYDDVVDLLFEERASAIATFICRKLYQEFVYAVPDEALVAELADLFVANDFEIAPVLRTLLKSAHFFDEQVIGARVKSPVELLVGMLLETQVPPAAETFTLLYRAAHFMGQALLDPPNVAGWPGHHAWLTTTTLPIRWLIADVMLFGGEGQPRADLLPLAAALQDPNDPMAVFYLPTALAEHFLPVPPETLDIGEVAEDFAGDLAAYPVPDAVRNDAPHVQNLAKRFLSGIPWYEWSLYADTTPGLLLGYTRYLLQLPEYHLI